MSKEISHQSVFGEEIPRDPLDSEYPVQYYVEELSDEVIECLPVGEIQQKSRAKSHSHLNGTAAGVSLVEEWFDSHVLSDEFDADVYQAARRRAANYVITQLPSDEAS